ncbi:MAG: hypothetical protein ACO1OB_16975 [Archangium sp.]
MAALAQVELLNTYLESAAHVLLTAHYDCIEACRGSRFEDANSAVCLSVEGCQLEVTRIGETLVVSREGVVVDTLRVEGGRVVDDAGAPVEDEEARFARHVLELVRGACGHPLH